MKNGKNVNNFDEMLNALINEFNNKGDIFEYNNNLLNPAYTYLKRTHRRIISASLFGNESAIFIVNNCSFFKQDKIINEIKRIESKTIKNSNELFIREKSTDVAILEKIKLIKEEIINYGELRYSIDKTRNPLYSFYINNLGLILMQSELGNEDALFIVDNLVKVKKEKSKVKLFESITLLANAFKLQKNLKPYNTDKTIYSFFNNNREKLVKIALLALKKDDSERNEIDKVAMELLQYEQIYNSKYFIEYSKKYNIDTNLVRKLG